MRAKVYKLLPALVLAGLLLGGGALYAQHPRISVGIGIGAPAYVPPSPGPGYYWVRPYWNGYEWQPGYWAASPSYYGGGYYGGGGVYFGGQWQRGRDRDRDWHRDRGHEFRENERAERNHWRH
jgi:hypothetical protein